MNNYQTSRTDNPVLNRVPHAMRLKAALCTGLLICMLSANSHAQTAFSECGTFDLDPLGTCLVFYPDDPSWGMISADLGNLPLPLPGTPGLLSGNILPCTGICFPTWCISGATFTINACNPPAQPEFIRGDCNNDMSFNLADVIYHLTSLFAAGPPAPCRSACDMDVNNADNIADSIMMLSILFQNGPPPPAPYPDCGPAAPGNLTLDCLNPICP